MLRGIIVAVALILAVVVIIESAAWVATHPQNFPWTRLSLNQPIGRYTAAKLAALGDDPPRCRALLADAGILDRPAPALSAVSPCGYSDGMRLDRDPAFRPANLVTACPVAAALALWERDVIQPAARRHLVSSVTAIDHAGSYSCRRIDGRADGRFSEHATANAIDITGFRTADGRRISLIADWRGGGAKAAFLRDIRDGACTLFATTLSPDYNAAHADHFHLDQASRGAIGGTMCR